MKQTVYRVRFADTNEHIFTTPSREQATNGARAYAKSKNREIIVEMDSEKLGLRSCGYTPEGSVKKYWTENTK